ncbi:sensor histidine kinase [Nitriliruptor alkaliphilus]|uniref:sensor histidine kinase n=1 Tax=Nitriliruptor alkaliphilus TaxID=427918 RepID=UPI000698A0F8|nr:sensor histidine kinase [Nitriliruptor alkaliphilus]
MTTTDVAPDASPSPRVSGRGLALDAMLAAILTGLLIVNGAVLPELGIVELPTPTAVTWTSGVVMCATLAFRRLAPLSVLVVVAVTFSVYGFNGGLDTFGSNIALFLAVVTAGSHGRAVARDVVRGVVIAGLFGTLFWAFVRGTGIDAGLYRMLIGQIYAVALNVFYFAAAWILGDQVRQRGEREHELSTRTSELAARTVELEHERQRTAEQAATSERLRLARELHDVLGHHVSVMGVQAAAARRVLARDPERASAALEAIEGSSRHAVTELQRVLQLLRSDDDQAAPALTVQARLDGLARELRRAGVEVTCQVAGLPPLPTEIDLAVGRVVQEALTNVLRHSGPGTSAWVRLHAAGTDVEVEVVDDGRGTPLVERHGGGTGLTGMRERVELHGGRFAADRVRRGGYRVHASIPLLPDGDAGEPARIDAAGTETDAAVDVVRAPS